MNSLAVIPCQSKVKLVGSDFIGTVVTIQISYDHVIYQVSWWDRTDRNMTWFEPFEIESITEAKIEIKFGFKAE